MNKKTIIVAAVIGVTGLLASQDVFAYRGDPSKKAPNYSSERHEAMQEVFARNDYQGWKSLMQGHGRASQIINEGNFDKFVKARELSQVGKVEEANAIRAELGLGNGNHGEMGGGCRGGLGR